MFAPPQDALSQVAFVNSDTTFPQELDLRPGFDPGPRGTVLLHEAAMDSRKDANAAIDAVTARLGAHAAWLYSASAERNPLASDLFYRLAGLALVERLRLQGRLPSRLVTDSPALQRILTRWATNAGLDVAVTLRPSRSRLERAKRILRDALGTAAWQLWVLAAARLSGRPDPTPEEPVILRDIFVLRDAPLTDRYFPGLGDCLSLDERRRLRLVPTVSGNGFRGFVGLFCRLRNRKNTGDRLLLKEDHLTWADCLAALATPLAGLFLRVGPVSFRGFDVGDLVREDLRELRNYSSMVVAGLNERFAARLAAHGVRVAGCLSWFENQAVDRGWQRGFSRHYPAARRTGYMGYVHPPLYASVFPTRGERQAGVLPNVLAVMGPALAAAVVEFCPGLDVLVAPAFRFAYLTGERPQAKLAPTRVVVPLPMNAPDALRVFSLVVQAARAPALSGATFLVKAHPGMNKAVLSPLLHAGLPENVHLVNQPVMDLMPGSAALVGTASSVCVEALCLGVPVALLARPGGVLLNPLPESLRDGMWRLCVTPDDLTATLVDFHNRAETLGPAYAEAVENLRRGLFTPITPEGVRTLLGLTRPREPAPNGAFVRRRAHEGENAPHC